MKLVFFLLVILIPGCATMEVPREQDPAVRLDFARKAYTEKRYDTAMELLKQFISDYPGTSFTDDAIYYLGSSYLNTGEYVLGATEFERLVHDFPKGAFTPRAEYELGLCYFGQSRPAPYDQEMTLRALFQFERVKSEYPETSAAVEARRMVDRCRSRLSEKAFRTGILYMKLGFPEVARRYFEEILTDYSDTSWADRALFEEGLAFEKQGLFDEALAVYGKVRESNPDGDFARRAVKRMAAVEKEIRKGDRRKEKSTGR